MKDQEKQPPHIDNIIYQEAVLEAHHRVKNTLQNLISYINLMFASRENIDKSEIQKLINHIHSLSLIHDILFEQTKKNDFNKIIRIDLVLHQLIELISLNRHIEFELLPEFSGSPRLASSLSLIINELLDNATRHGKDKIKFQIRRQTSGLMTIRIENDIQSVPALSNLKDSTGLKLARMLTKVDLKSELTTQIINQTFLAEISFSTERE
ncbi:MAG: histidine kinase dimerization/phosphoacceptor domain -containing protein [bacterium]|nr:histidine kinase dimerization/phosphoacceptor domain -containing protein [bacterium]